MRAILMFPALTVKDKVTRQTPQTTTFFEREGEPKRNRTEVPSQWLPLEPPARSDRLTADIVASVWFSSTSSVLTWLPV